MIKSNDQKVTSMTMDLGNNNQLLDQYFSSLKIYPDLNEE